MRESIVLYAQVLAIIAGSLASMAVAGWLLSRLMLAVV